MSSGYDVRCWDGDGCCHYSWHAELQSALRWRESLLFDGYEVVATQPHREEELV